MKKILLFFAFILIFSCSFETKGTVNAKLRITQCGEKFGKENVLLLTTIYENKTGKDIYLIKGYPISSQFTKQFSDTMPRSHDFRRIPALPSKCFRNSVNPLNYLEKQIYPFPTRTN